MNIVFTLSDQSGVVRYASHGPAPAPWLALWQSRNDVDSSPLADWLKSLSAIPRHCVIATGVSQYQAEELLAVIRQGLKTANADLLSSRPSDSFKTGGGIAIGCVIDGSYYPSQREAAKALNVSVATISRRIANEQDPAAYRASEQLTELLQ